MTLDYATKLQEKAEADLRAAHDEQASAKQALTEAQQAHYRAASKASPLSEAERDSLGAAEHQLLQAKSRVAKSNFALRRAEQAAAESKQRVERLQPHAALLEKLDRACAAVAEKDANARRLVARFVGEELRGAVREVWTAIEEGAAVYNQLPVEARPDVSHPVHAAPLFGGIDYRDSALLRWIARFPESTFTQAPPAKPWKGAA